MTEEILTPRARFYLRLSDFERIIDKQALNDLTEYVISLEQELEAIKKVERARWESGWAVKAPKEQP